MKRSLAAVSVLCLALCGASVHAATQYWDTDGSVTGNSTSTGAGLGGNGNWSTAVANWWNGSGAANVSWTEGNDAVFWGTAGTVSLSGPRTANSLTIKTAGYFITNSTLTLTGGALFDAQTGTTLLGSTLLGTVGYTKNGAGTLTLTNLASSITGPVAINNGVLDITTSGRIGGTGVGSGDITINGGTLRNDDATGGNSFLTANRSIIIGASGGTLGLSSSAQILVYSGNISGSGNTLTVSGSTGEFRCTTNSGIATGGHNTFGKLVVDAAIFTIGNSATGGAEDSLGAVPSVTTADAITLQNGGRIRGNVYPITLDAKRGITIGAGGGTLRAVNSSSTLTIPSVIAGSAGNNLTIGTIDTGSVTLSGVNTYSGKTILNTGTLNISSDARLGTVPAAFVADQLTLNGGTIAFTATAVDIATNRGITIGAGGCTLSVSASQSPSIESVIAGSGLLTKSTSGNINLNATNTFTGGLTITGGGVRFNNNQAAGTGTITVTPASIVTLRQLSPPGPTSVTLTNPITLNANGGNDIDLACASANTFTLSNSITGAGYLTRDRGTAGNGTVVLAGDNSGWSGGLLVRGSGTGLGHKRALGTGTLGITPANADPTTFSATTALTGANAVTNVIQVAISNATQQVTIGGANDVEFSGPISLGQVGSLSPVILTNNNAGATILSGPISGSGFGLTIAGTGTLTLKGVNTYNGDTTVSSGTLALSGSGSVNSSPNIAVASGATLDVFGVTGGTYSLASGQTLKGNGGVKGTVAVASGATVAPGASIGTLYFTNAPTLSGTSSMEIDRAAVPNADKLVVMTGGGTLNYGGTLTVVNNGATLQRNDTFDLFDADSFSGSFATLNLPSLPAGLAWDTSKLTVDGTIKVVCNGTLSASAGGPQTICLGSSVGIGGSPTASGGSGSFSYGWAPATGLNNTGIANPTASPTSTTTYTVTVTDSVGCTAQAQVLVTVNARPTSVVSGGATICNGASATVQAALTGTGPWNVTWSDSFSHSVASSPDIRSVSPGSTTTYTVTALSDVNCTAQAGDRTGSATVTVEAGPLKWVDANGNWDFTTTGLWQDANSVASTYCDAYNVLLDDSATVASPAITLNTTVAPASVTNSSTKNYSISGTGKITGAGTLTKSGSSMLTIGTTNDFTGATTVSGGTLLVNGVLGSGGATVQSGATLGGSGSVGGTVTVQNGGALAPGSSIGTLTLSNSPSLGGTNLMEIDNSASPNADKLNVLGALAFGGVLTVNNIGPALAGGETFDLFDATGFSGSFSATNLPALGAGLNWWTDRLGVDGTINVNRAPTATDKTLTREKDVTMKIAKTDVMAGNSDPDSGDSASYDTLVSTGTQGATVTEDATYIYYEPVNNNSDTLQYRVKDTRGGLTTKNIQINVVNGTGQVESLTVSGGIATATFAGVPGYGYEIQRSTNLVAWVTLLTTNAPTNGLFQYVDNFSDLASPPPSAYYRLRQP